MSTYAIGDIQGCREQLEQLLELINFDPVSDKLWFAGDLVNRGPDSLGTLRLIHSLRDSAIVVLGNHDLHMLAVNAMLINGIDIKVNPKDNFYPILEAEDGETLLEWLRFCPLVHSEDDFLLVHAGIYPLWDKAAVLAFAKEVEHQLQGDDSLEFYRQMYGNQPAKWSTELKGFERLRFITNSLTRMRYCYKDYSLDMDCKGPIDTAPNNLTPWYEMNSYENENNRQIEETILHGHWAALMEKEPAHGIISLDTGCVWGNKLSAWCLEQKRWYQVPGIKQ